ncbi:hypothetical protein FACS1894200_08140 [Spirochaetia bacterium]|nr:hypothetical protein FACS1894200_08140 [Spirochaetia bacterium]
MKYLSGTKYTAKQLAEQFGCSSLVKWYENELYYWTREYDKSVVYARDVISSQEKVISNLEEKVRLLDSIISTRFFSGYSYNSGSYNPSAAMSDDKICFVYIAKQLNESGIYKIGVSKDITQREKTFKCGNLFVQIVATLETPNPYNIENNLHKYYSHSQIGGEWFYLSEDDIQFLVDVFGFKFQIGDDKHDK